MRFHLLTAAILSTAAPLAALAADKEKVAPEPILMAGAEVPAALAEAFALPSPESLLQPLLTAEIGSIGASAAAEEESLPETPSYNSPGLLLEWKPSSAGTEERAPLAKTPRFDVERLPDTPGVSRMESIPLAARVRHMGAQHFNTEDGSSVDSFAICYRLNGRSSVQVIPGDPAPVKLPLNTMANNMGVTVGMVVRLSRSR